MKISYKTQLNPNNKQKTLFVKHAGCVRWIYNWALAKKKEAFDKKEKIPNYIDLSREFTQLKKTEIPWMYEVSAVATQTALINCDTAFDNFFRKCKQKIPGAKGFPKFKTKHGRKQSFKLIAPIHIKENKIKLPKIGWVKLCQKDYIPIDKKVISATVSKRADRWFVSVLVEEVEKQPTEPKNFAIGVDLGIKTLATCSDGTAYENPKALQKNLKKLKRLSRQHSRKKKGSNNREKARKKLAKLHYRISNIRKDALHKTTTKIINENQVIVLEDLNILEMQKDRRLSQAINDVGFGEFKRQIIYKADRSKRKVVFVDRFYPSSKLCSCCDWKNENLSLSDRTFHCKNCSNVMDRDLNAAKNILKFYTASSAGINASGDGSSSNASSVSPSMKEEFNQKFEASPETFISLK